MIARGRVLGVAGGLIEATLPGARLGDVVRIAGERAREGSVRAARDGALAIAPHGALEGIVVGAPVYGDGGVRRPLGAALFGRAVDGLGMPLDARTRPRGLQAQRCGDPPSPAERLPVERPLWTGVRAIDGLLTIGVGARLGVFGSPGTGKSSLLEAIVRGVCADAVVIAAIGERGREAERWIATCDRRTTVFCATAGCAAPERVAATRYALAHAAHLRARGLDVLVVLDSLARVAYALREVAVAAGESVGRGGYPVSVFAEMARLVEAAGTTRTGSVTLLATVLSDGDDRDPVCEAARSLLDGHVALDLELARAGAFPAIDVLASLSRTMASVTSLEHRADAAAVRAALDWLHKTRDARELGIPVEGPGAGYATAEPALAAFLRQASEASASAATLAALAELADTLEETHEHR